MVEFSSWESFGRADKQIASSEQKKIYPKEKAADVSRMTPGRGCLVASSLRAFLKRRLHFLGRGSRVSNEALPDVWVSLSLSLSLGLTDGAAARVDDRLLLS